MNLDASIEQAFRTLEPQKKALNKLQIKTVEDLLYHFPVRYGDTSEIKNIGSLIVGESAVVFGTITGLKTSKAFIKKTPMAEAIVTDETGRIKIIWFHQAYLAKMIHEGAVVRVEGKISERKGNKQNELYFSNPKIETVGKVPIGVGKNLFANLSDDKSESHFLYPIYPESRGVSSNWIYHNIERIFKSGLLEKIVDPIPTDILEKYHLPNIKDALIYIHTPKKESDALAARKRFAFQEIFFIQLEKQRERASWKKEKTFEITADKKSVDEFVSRFPFKATEAQQKSIDTILSDFASNHPMSRLLEGDVGSGKTAVAAATTFAIVTSRPHGQRFGNLQVAYMAPTEILAKQQFENFIQFFRGTGIAVGLVTGSGCRKFPSKLNPDGWTNISKSQLAKWVANGEIPIVVGTHALVYKSITFKHLAFVIIDEQHRFGTMQRQRLTEKNLGKTNSQMPHLLSMTATPIPRTLSLTVYGDLDLSLLDQMPVGRKPVITKIVLPKDRTSTYKEIEKMLIEGRQLYIICPRINEPDPTKESAVIAKSVTEEAKRLQTDVFPKWKIGILHSKMTPAEKEKSMLDFAEHKTDILVATSVVEVGVNVPNATMIVIEGAERFGLSQLHQLRGRVIRSNHQAYCYVFTESTGAKTVARLKALSTAKNGFELAEFDLQQRGSGELYGGKQWGVSDLAMDALQNIKMVEAAREEAKRIIAEDVELKKYPLLREQVRAGSKIHME